MEKLRKTPDENSDRTAPQKPVLIFDFGGVLLDWDPRSLFSPYFDGDREAMEKFLVEIDFFGWNFKQDQGGAFADGVAELSARFPEYARMIRAYDDDWQTSIRGPIQSTVDILEPLKQSGYSLYGLTNWSAEKFHLVAHQYEFFNIFEYILVSGVVRLAKPDPRIFSLLLERIGRPAQECILIDDSIVNIEAARRLGFKTIHFVSARQMLDELAGFVTDCEQ